MSLSAPLIPRLYDFALDDDLWTHVLPAFSEAFRAQGAAFIRSRGPEAGCVANHNLPTEVVHDYLSRAAEIDRWCGSLQTGARHASAIYRGHELRTGERSFGSGIDFDGSRPSAIEHVMGALVRERAGQPASSCLTLYRPRPAGAFSEAEANELESLAPHLRRVVKLRDALDEERVDGAWRALETMALPLVLFAADGTIVAMTAAARLMLRRHPAVRTTYERLSSACTNFRAELESAVADIVRHTSTGSALRLSGHAPDGLVLRLVPKPASLPAKRSAVVLGSLAEEARRPGLSELELVALYDLTRTEATLALELASGLSVEAFANRHHLRISTVRTHLKHAFTKTNTHTQKDLARLVGMLDAC